MTGAMLAEQMRRIEELTMQLIDRYEETAGYGIFGGDHVMFGGAEQMTARFGLLQIGGGQFFGRAMVRRRPEDRRSEHTLSEQAWPEGGRVHHRTGINTNK